MDDQSFNKFIEKYNPSNIEHFYWLKKLIDYKNHFQPDYIECLKDNPFKIKFTKQSLFNILNIEIIVSYLSLKQLKYFIKKDEDQYGYLFKNCLFD